MKGIKQFKPYKIILYRMAFPAFHILLCQLLTVVSKASSYTPSKAKVLRYAVSYFVSNGYGRGRAGSSNNKRES